MVYATSLRITRNRADAEDVAQECFLALAKATDTIKSSLPCWLHWLATRRSLDVLRSAQRRKRRENLPANISTPPGSTTADWNELQTYVDEAIGALPRKLRDPVIAHFLEGQSYHAVGEALGLPRSTVASRVQKALELVRKTLENRGVQVTPASLSALLLSNGSGAVAPPTLTSALGKLAISGGSSATLVTALPPRATLVALKKVAALTLGAATPISARTASDGHYELNGLAPGPLQIRAQLTANGIRLEHSAMVKAGEAQELDFSYEPGTAVVDGRITLDDATPASAQLSLWLLSSDQKPRLTVSADENGLFHFEKLPPGEARLKISARAANGEQRSRFVWIELKEGGVTRTDANLAGRGHIAGQVLGTTEGQIGAVFLVEAPPGTPSPDQGRRLETPRAPCVRRSTRSLPGFAGKSSPALRAA